LVTRVLLSFFFSLHLSFHSSLAPPDLPPFPTRRSLALFPPFCEDLWRPAGPDGVSHTVVLPRRGVFVLTPVQGSHPPPLLGLHRAPYEQPMCVQTHDRHGRARWAKAP